MVPAQYVHVGIPVGRGDQAADRALDFELLGQGLEALVHLPIWGAALQAAQQLVRGIRGIDRHGVGRVVSREGGRRFLRFQRRRLLPCRGLNLDRGVIGALLGARLQLGFALLHGQGLGQLLRQQQGDATRNEVALELVEVESWRQVVQPVLCVAHRGLLVLSRGGARGAVRGSGSAGRDEVRAPSGCGDPAANSYGGFMYGGAGDGHVCGAGCRRGMGARTQRAGGGLLRVSVDGERHGG